MISDAAYPVLGKNRRKDRTLTQFTFDFKLRLMAFQYMLDNGQPQACTSHFTGTAMIDTIKTFGQPRQMFSSNPNTGICYRKTPTMPIG